MEYSEAYNSNSQISLQSATTKSKMTLVVIFVELTFVILSLIEVYHESSVDKTYKPGLFNGGISKLINDVSSGQFFADTAKFSMLISLVFTAFVNGLTLLILIHKRESKHVQNFGLLLTIIFTVTELRLINAATKNLIFLLMGAVYLSALYWYYLKYGEIRSFLDNRVIIFSLRRTVAIIPMFIAISLFTFFALNFIADPVALATARIRFGKAEIQNVLLRKWGLVDENGVRVPAWKRYLAWAYDFLHGNLGVSYEHYPQTVNEGIQLKLYLTLKLQLISLILAFIFSVVLGIAAAYYHKTPADASFSAIALLGLSMPIFVSGILAILIFGGTGLAWFPVNGAYDVPSIIALKCGPECLRRPEDIWHDDFTSKPIFQRPWFNFSWWGMFLKVFWYYSISGIQHTILPALTIIFATMALFTRLTRGTVLEILRQDYILAARANGLTEYQIIRNHALKNVLLPLVTFLGINVGGVLVGAPITETIFSYPGLGAYFIAALGLYDTPVIMGLVMIITLMILFANLIADIVYTWLDPRLAL